MTTVLAVEALSARYGAVSALSGVSLTVGAGEVVAVVGPNGAGKTTLVRCVAGLHREVTGAVSVAGRALRHRDPVARRRAGVRTVGDRRDLVPSLTVDRYLRLVLDAAGVAEAHAMFPALGPVAGRRCGLLSGGEAQMLALGRALAGRPTVVVLDEMSQGLAPAILGRLLPIVRSAADDGAAVLLVEQFAHAAAGIADRVVVLDHGEIAFAGPPDDAPLDDVYLAAGERPPPGPTPVLTDVTVGLLPSQRRALAAAAIAEGRFAGELVRDAVDAYLAASAVVTASAVPARSRRDTRRG